MGESLFCLGSPSLTPAMAEGVPPALPWDLGPLEGTGHCAPPGWGCGAQRSQPGDTYKQRWHGRAWALGGPKGKTPDSCVTPPIWKVLRDYN